MAAPLAACAAANTPQACRLVPAAETALTLQGGRAIVAVTLDGQPARLMLDTGSNVMLLSEAAVRRLGLRYDLRFTVNIATIGAHGLSRATEPVTIGIGAAQLEPVNMLVAGPETGISMSQGVDGLLGTGALAAYDLDIDLPHGRLGLYQPRRCPATSPLDGAAVTFQVSPNPGRRMHVPVQVDGRELSLLVDTGATATYLNEQRTGLDPAALATDRELPIHSAGPDGTRVHAHRFARFALGHHRVDHPTLLVGPLQTGEDGLLGIDYLRHRRLWLSFAGWAVTLQQPP